MGFWKDVFTDNKPCFAFHIEWDDKPKEGAKELIEENRKFLEMCEGCLWDYKMKPTESVFNPAFREDNELL